MENHRDIFIDAAKSKNPSEDADLINQALRHLHSLEGIASSASGQVQEYITPRMREINRLFSLLQSLGFYFYEDVSSYLWKQLEGNPWLNGSNFREKIDGYQEALAKDLHIASDARGPSLLEDRES